MPTAPCAGAARGARRGQSRARPRERRVRGERELLFQCAAGQGGRRCRGVDRERGTLPWSCALAGIRAGRSVTFLPHGVPRWPSRSKYRVVSWDHHMGLIREVRPYKTRNNAPQKVRKMPHEKASTYKRGAAIIPGHY